MKDVEYIWYRVEQVRRVSVSDSSTLPQYVTVCYDEGCPVHMAVPKRSVSRSALVH